MRANPTALAILSAARRLAGGPGARVRLADLLDELRGDFETRPLREKSVFQAAILQLEAMGAIVLYDLDAPWEIDYADQAAAVPNSFGNPRYILYVC